jgi:hypothetical protein
MLHMVVGVVVVHHMVLAVPISLVLLGIIPVLTVLYILVVAEVEELTWVQKRGHILAVLGVQVVIQVLLVLAGTQVPVVTVAVRLQVLVERQVYQLMETDM